MKWLRRIFRRKPQEPSVIPANYFGGLRRLAPTRADVEEGKCWCCKHAVAYVSWWCDLERCKWESCFVAEELNKKDLRKGKDGLLPSYHRWIGLPDESSRN